MLPAVEGYEVVENKFELNPKNFKLVLTTTSQQHTEATRLLWRKALSLVVANELLEEDNVDFREGSAEEYEGVELICLERQGGKQKQAREMEITTDLI